MILSTHTHSLKDSGGEHILVLAFLLLGLRFLYAFCEKFLSKLIKITFSIWITFYEFVHKITATLDSCPGPAAVPAAIPSPGPAQTTPDDTPTSLSGCAFVQWNFCSSTEISALPTTFLCCLLLLACPSGCLYLKCGKYLFATPEIRVAKGNETKRSELRRNSLIAMAKMKLTLKFARCPQKVIRL